MCVSSVSLVLLPPAHTPSPIPPSPPYVHHPITAIRTLTFHSYCVPPSFSSPLTLACPPSLPHFSYIFYSFRSSFFPLVMSRLPFYRPSSSHSTSPSLPSPSSPPRPAPPLRYFLFTPFSPPPSPTPHTHHPRPVSHSSPPFVSHPLSPHCPQRHTHQGPLPPSPAPLPVRPSPHLPGE